VNKAALCVWTDPVQDAGLRITALSLFLAPVGVAIGLALLWIGWLMACFRPGSRSLPMSAGVWLGLAFGVYIVLHGLAWTDPVNGLAERTEATLDWLQLCVFVPFAYALRADQSKLLHLFLLILAGLLAGMCWRLDWALLLSDPSGFVRSRPGFGFPTIVFGLFSGTVLLGLLALRCRWWRCVEGRPGIWRFLLWLLSIALVAQGFILTLARGASIALLVTLAIGSRFRDRCVHPAGLVVERSRPMLLVVAVLVLGLLALNAKPVVDRMGEEWDLVAAMLSGEIAYSQASSFSQRWHVLRFGIDAWLLRPWFGWGPGSSKSLIELSGEPALRMPDGAPLVHVHNTYVEILVQLGWVGLLLWLAILFALLASLRRGLQMGRLSPDVAGFLMLAILYLGLWSLFDFHAVHQDWRGFWAVLAGSALSFGLFGRVR
jgi:O-antigen ligase